jgi:D-lactate dehydratase
MTIASTIHHIKSKFSSNSHTMPLPRRALIAITSATAPLHDGKPTGMFISEALHPYNVFIAAGFEVDIVSETGKYFVDWLSTTPDFLDDELKKTWEDKTSGFRTKLDHMPDVKTLDGKNVS